MSVTPMELVAQARKNISTIDSIEAEEMIHQGATLIDVREPAEFATGFIPNAINIPRGILEFFIGSHPIAKDKNALYVVYCRTTNRAIMATDSLKKIGYTNAHALTVGFPEWVNAGGKSSLTA
jgi:rhodanese-related sulfurtransferase